MQSKYALAALPFSALDRLSIMPRPRVPVSYVVEAANWATRWDGILVSRGINEIAPKTARTIERPNALTSSVAHFFSHYQWLAWSRWLARSNRYVVTFYHGKRSDDRETDAIIGRFVQTSDQMSCVITAAKVVEKRLVEWGIDAAKVIRIPIPIDVEAFRPPVPQLRMKARADLGLKPDCFVVGNFQKDGVGWGDGQDPKMIKGPDVLVETLRLVNRQQPVTALLTGPARGYVKGKLDSLGIPYVHRHVESYQELPKFYAAIDAYLNPSREEGGPKGILEAMACGVPTVSTEVGMAPDVIDHGVTGYLAPVEHSEALADALLTIAANSHPQGMAARGRDAVLPCHYKAVARLHWDKVLTPQLRALDREIKPHLIL